MNRAWSAKKFVRPDDRSRLMGDPDFPLVVACARVQPELTRTGRVASSQEAEMKTFDRITRDPAMLSCQPTVRGMRLTVRRVVEAVALYPNRDDLFAEYPELEPEA
jgi:uncharacterized protein (DUF433 family)